MVTKYFGFFGVNYARETPKAVSLKMDPDQALELCMALLKAVKAQKPFYIKVDKRRLSKGMGKVPAGKNYATVTAD